jgi:hypothetical protein
VCEELPDSLGRIATKVEPPDDGIGDDVLAVCRGKRRDQQQEWDEGGERLRGDCHRAVDALHGDEGTDATTDERSLQPPTDARNIAR